MSPTVDHGRAGIDWDTYEPLAVQLGVLAYTAGLLLTVLVVLLFSWAFMAAISRSHKKALSDIAQPVPTPEGASRWVRSGNAVLNGLNTGLVHLVSMTWYAWVLRVLWRQLLPICVAAIVAVLVYYLSLGMALSYLYCVEDDRADRYFKCSPAEAERVVPFDVFGRVIETGIYG